MIAGIRSAWHPLAVPGVAGFGVYEAHDPDALLDEIGDEDFKASDERLPYFSLLWAAGESLARAVLAGPALAGKRVLDLGCGVGVAGLAAARRGGRVTFLDWEPRAHEFVRASAKRLGVTPEAHVVADWRKPGDVADFDLVLGADVLYDARNAPGVARFLAAALAPGGEAWVADPSRLHAAAFPPEATARGLVVLESGALPTNAEKVPVNLLRIRRPAPTAP